MNFKQITLLLGTGISFSTHAAQIKQREVKERDEKSCAQRATQALPQQIIIDDTQEFLKTEQLESFTDKPFATLIKEQWSKCDPYLLARVVVRSKDGRDSVHYYDGHAFAQDRYGTYPLQGNLQTTITIQSPGHEAYSADKFNPHNTQIAQVSVHYFVYDPQNSEDGFTLEFTEQEIKESHNPNFYYEWLAANQNFDPSLKAIAQVLVGKSYYHGRGVDQNYDQDSTLLLCNPCLLYH